MPRLAGFRERVHQPFWETIDLTKDPEAPSNFFDVFGNLWSIEDDYGDADWLGVEVFECRSGPCAVQVDRWEIVLDVGDLAIASSPRTTPHPFLIASR